MRLAALLAVSFYMLAAGSIAAAQQHSSYCQGRVCWPVGPKPPWLDRSYARLEDGTLAPVLAAGRLRTTARLFAATGLDPRTCTLTESWRGVRRGPHGERERIEGQATSGPPVRVVPGDGGAEALFEIDAPLPGTQVAVDSFAGIACGDVSFSLSYASETVVGTDDVLPLVCALRPPPRTPRDVQIRLPENIHHVRLAARYGAALRHRGTMLVDACSGRDLLDLATLGVPLAAIDVPEVSAITPHERGLSLWGDADLRSARDLVRNFHGFNGEWLGFSFARPPTPAELVPIRAALAAVPELAIADTMDDVPQP